MHKRLKFDCSKDYDQDRPLITKTFAKTVKVKEEISCGSTCLVENTKDSVNTSPNLET